MVFASYCFCSGSSPVAPTVHTHPSRTSCPVNGSNSVKLLVFCFILSNGLRDQRAENPAVWETWPVQSGICYICVSLSILCDKMHFSDTLGSNPDNLLLRGKYIPGLLLWPKCQLKILRLFSSDIFPQRKKATKPSSMNSIIKRRLSLLLSLSLSFLHVLVGTVPAVSFCISISCISGEQRKEVNISAGI